jgi:Glycopeptide antibiotics resistance protein
MQIKTKKHIKEVGLILFLIYIGFLVYFLFFSEEYNRNIISESYRYNFTPFKEIMRFWHYRHQLGAKVVVINIIGNIGAFIPFGLFVPIISIKLRKAWKVILLGILLSGTVEFLQLVTKVGSFDVDDIILNTVGTIIGYLLFCICNAIWRKTYGKKI